MNTHDVVIFLYGMAVKNEHGNDFPYVSAFSKHPKSLVPASLEEEETVTPLNKV